MAQTNTEIDELGRRRRADVVHAPVANEGEQLRGEINAIKSELKALRALVMGMTIEGLPGNGPNGISCNPTAESTCSEGRIVTTFTFG